MLNHVPATCSKNYIDRWRKWCFKDKWLKGNTSQNCGASPAIWDHNHHTTQHRWMHPAKVNIKCVYLCTTQSQSRRLFLRSWSFDDEPAAISSTPGRFWPFLAAVKNLLRPKISSSSSFSNWTGPSRRPPLRSAPENSLSGTNLYQQAHPLNYPRSTYHLNCIKVPECFLCICDFSSEKHNKRWQLEQVNSSLKAKYCPQVSHTNPCDLDLEIQ